MNADRLLAHFEQINDAPDAVNRLRRFILDLAVRGKLVPSEAGASLPAVPDGVPTQPTGKALDLPLETLPFAVPAYWRWAYLTTIATVQYGYAFASARFNTSRQGMPLIRIRDIASRDTEAYYDGEYEKCYIVEEGDYLVGMDGDFNVRRWCGPKALLNQRVLRMNGWNRDTHGPWCVIPLQMILDHVHGQTSQTTVKHLSAKQMNGIRIPLPPLAEQHRIVEKVDELMKLCDQLEASQKERESRRDRLVVASLNRLSRPTNPDELKKDAGFTLSNLNRLSTKPEHIKELRKAILNLAVRGRLVPQDEREEPFTDQASDGGDLEKRLDMQLPAGWRWVQVRDVGESRLGKMLDKAKNRGKPYRYLRNTNVHWFEIRLEEIKTMPLAAEEVNTFLLAPGDVLICEGGHGIARTAVWRGDGEEMAFQKALHRVRPGKRLIGDFLSYCIRVYFDEGVLQRLYTGVGIPHFTGVALAKLGFPLPPLAEQKRIVAKVDELMLICDQLETQLEYQQKGRRQLLEALLHEALEVVG